MYISEFSTPGSCEPSRGAGHSHGVHYDHIIYGRLDSIFTVCTDGAVCDRGNCKHISYSITRQTYRNKGFHASNLRNKEI